MPLNFSPFCGAGLIIQTLTVEQETVFTTCLAYGPKSSQVVHRIKVVFMVPRLGTISPWSSKSNRYSFITVALRPYLALELGVGILLFHSSEPLTLEAVALLSGVA